MENSQKTGRWVYWVCILVMALCTTVMFKSRTHPFFKENHIGTLVAKDKAIVREGKYSEETAYMFAFELDNNTNITQRFSLYEYAKFNVGDKFNIEISANKGWVTLAILINMFAWLVAGLFFIYRLD